MNENKDCFVMSEQELAELAALYEEEAEYEQRLDDLQELQDEIEEKIVSQLVNRNRDFKEVVEDAICEKFDKR